MNKRLNKSFIGLTAVITAAGGYQLFAQSSTTSTGQSSSSPAVAPPAAPARPAASRATGIGTSYSTAPDTAEVRRLYSVSSANGQPGWLQPNHNMHEAITMEDGKIKILTSKEPIDPETRAKSVEVHRKIEEAHRSFRSDNVSESEKAQAKTLLESFLKAQFDHDQEMRRKQIKSLEEEIEKLKKQITKREDSRDKLVELRMTLLENDANGLSFPPAFNQIPGASQSVNFSGSGFGISPNNGPSGLAYPAYPAYPATNIQGTMPNGFLLPSLVPPNPSSYEQNRPTEPAPAKR